MEGSVGYKLVPPEAPPSTIKSPKAEAPQKETVPTLPSEQRKLGQKEEAAKAGEYGYIVTNQRYITVSVCCMCCSNKPQ